MNPMAECLTLVPNKEILICEECHVQHKKDKFFWRYDKPAGCLGKKGPFQRFDNPHFSLYHFLARDPIRDLFEKNEKGGEGR